MASRVVQPLPPHKTQDFLSLRGSGITYSIAFVINLTGNPDELASASNTQVLELSLGRGLTGSLFYARYTKIVFQHVSNGFEKLGF